ncbi:unnamed protein product [Urochloa humidicola]
MATSSSPTLPLATKQPAPRERRFRRKASLALALVLLTSNSGVAAYLSWGDRESVASLSISYAILVLLFVSHLGGGCSEGARRRMRAAVCCLSSSLALLLGYKLLRVPPLPPTPVLLVAVAGSTALGVGGFLSFLIHRRSWYKPPRLEVIVPTTREVP